jgi:hypothetical protein
MVPKTIRDMIELRSKQREVVATNHYYESLRGLLGEKIAIVTSG